jgi:hypothetical protein
MADTIFGKILRGEIPADMVAARKFFCNQQKPAAKCKVFRG